MGKALVIRGADFSENAVAQEPAVTLFPTSDFSSMTDLSEVEPLQAWGPYVGSSKLAYGMKFKLPAKTSSRTNYQIRLVNIGDTYSSLDNFGQLLFEGELLDSISEKMIFFNEPIEVGGTKQIVLTSMGGVYYKQPIASSYPDYATDGWGVYTFCNGSSVGTENNPASNGNVYAFATQLIIGE